MYKKKPFKKKKSNEPEQPEIVRVRMPRGNETLGILEQRVGSSRTIVKCLDAKTRNCRIPGRLKRKLWVREGDIVLVQPWELGGDSKGDIIFKYRPAQVSFLRKKNMLNKLEDIDEF